MTLAPLVGQLVAHEVLAGASGSHSSSQSDQLSDQELQETAKALAPYRPDRDFDAAVTEAAAQPCLSWAATLNPSRQ